VGRYVLYGEIASGGMATVHFGRLIGPAGFARPVAIKRLHAQFARDPDFVKMFLDEARLAARIAHPNVVSTLDVVAEDGEVFLVMEYVPGTSLGQLVRTLRKSGARVPPLVAVGIVSGVLQGLQAAHEARDDRGDRLDLVHRDVSPQNVLVGTDGIARLLDFGVAKASGRMQTTRDGQLKGKLAYMAPEQVRGDPLTRRTDVYAAAVVLWEALTGKRLFYAENEASVLARVLCAEVPAPSSIVPELPRSFDRVVLRGLDRDPAKRYANAREMAADLDACVGAASPAEIGEWVQATATDELRQRAAHIAEVERSASELPPLTSSGEGTGVGPTGLAVAEMRSHVWGRTTDRPAQAPPARRAGEISQVSSLSLAQATERPGPRTSPKAVSTLLFSTSAAALLVGLIVFSQTRATSTTAAPATLAPTSGAIGLPTAPSAALGGPGLVREVPSSASARFSKPPLPGLGPTNGRPTAPVPESRPQPAGSELAAAPIAPYLAVAAAVAAPGGMAAGGHPGGGVGGGGAGSAAGANATAVSAPGGTLPGSVPGGASPGSVPGGTTAASVPGRTGPGAVPVGTTGGGAVAGAAGASPPPPAGTAGGGAPAASSAPAAGVGSGTAPAGTASGIPPAGHGTPGNTPGNGAPGGRAPAAAGSGTAEDCNPPYTADAKGHIHFKPSCL
jgi:serine/threonine-protein kinase